MSKYTTELRFICENFSGLNESKGYSNVEEIINNSRGKIFNFNYPIFDEEYRGVLETKILKHFYTREIGAETVGLWQLWLNTRMNEIMPYYNQLYKSTLYEFNPLYDTDITTDHNIDRNGNKDNNGTSTNNKNNTGSNETITSNHSTENDDRWNYYSDTPQGGITGLADMAYLTNASHDTDSDTINSNGNSNSSYTDTTAETGNTTGHEVYTDTETYIEHVRGKRGGISYSKMLEEFRQTILNIDMQIIDELSDLFFNLW